MIGLEKQQILDPALSGQGIDRATAAELAKAEGSDFWDLLAAAGRVREHFRGKTVDICSIVNAKSGACSEDCSYCAQSVHHHTDALVYPLIPVEDMAAAAESAVRNGAKRFCIVTSGRGIDTKEDLRNIAKGIERVRAAGLSPCATLGTLSRDQLAYLKDSGLHRYHHNIETSKRYFPQICRTHTFQERIDVLHDAGNLGLSACSGGIFGMGETMDDRIEMAFTLRDLGVDSVPINFLMPIPGTPLEKVAPIPPPGSAPCHSAVPADTSDQGDPRVRRTRDRTGPTASLHFSRRRGRLHDRQLSHPKRPGPENRFKNSA